MDGVRKLVGERLKAQTAGPHPEAELLAAFTENALLPSERETVVDHLAKCSVCRETVFLALPNPAEMQKVLAPVKRHPRFALRWGTLVAAIAVAAVLIVNRDQERKPKAFVKAQAQATENTIASENTPAEFRAMHTASADKTKAATYDEAANGRPEPKHMTAKPSVAMSFEDSGQVQVSPAANADQKLEAEAKDLPLRGRDATTLAKIPAGAAVQQSIGGPIAANQSAGYLAGANALAKQTGLHGALAGMVVDATGAAIPNAKVSATGPNGTTKTTISKSDGRFDVDQLANGIYSLKVEANGFRTTELSQVAVLDNKPAETRVTLNPGAVTETVEVSAAAAAPSADTAKTDESVTSGTTSANIAIARAPAQAETVEIASNKKLKNSRRAADLVTPTVFKWTIGNDGTVQRSADGKAWQTVSVAPGAKFQAISSVQLNVWVGGNSGALYHSADSGAHWVPVSPMTNGNKLQADITHIEFSDPQNGAVTTSAGQVWTTSDGGQSWQVK